MGNIAFVIHSLSSGGAERVVSTLANNLVKTHQVTIITFSKSEPFYELQHKINLVHCMDEIVPSKNMFQALRLNVQLYKRISRLIKELQIDVVIGFMTQANVLSVLAAKKNNVPVIISERNNPEKDFTPKFWKILRAIVYPFTNKLVVQTNPIKNHYQGKLPDNKLKILPNPLSESFTLTKPKGNKSIKENIFLNVGRLSHQKAQEILIRAFAELDIDDWELHLIGDGSKKSEYDELIDKYGLSHKIKLLGKVKDIPSYYLKSKIFVFPSRYEGFPNALTEAMYMGLPAIAADCPTGPSELINDGENGFLIPIDDVSALKKKMKALAENEDLRDKFGLKAESSVANLEASKISNQWLDLIHETLQNK